MKIRIIIALLGGLALAGCYYDREEDLYPPPGNCETTNVTYSAMIVPLLQNYSCNSCHSGPAPSDNISLDNYTGVKAVALNGKLFGAISHSAGFSPMPQGGNKLSACNIDKVKAWIDAGAPNN